MSDKSLSLKKINKHINHDLKLLNIWLRTNKISLNASKTEIILFRPKSQSNITKHLNFRISGQYISEELVKLPNYLGLILKKFLSWSTYYIYFTKKEIKQLVYFQKFNILLLNIY